MPEEKDIDRVVNAMNLAVAGAEYADTISIEVANVSGDNYELVWSTIYNGAFVPNEQKQ